MKRLFVRWLMPEIRRQITQAAASNVSDHLIDRKSPLTSTRRNP